MTTESSIDLLVQTDIHHDNGWTNGLREDDILGVEEQFRQEIERRRPDLVLFGGDRFRPRRPADEVKVAADAALARRAQTCAAIGADDVELVGNHDRDTQSRSSGHTLRVVRQFPHLFPRMHVIDETGTVQLVTRTGVRVCVHGVPAERQLDMGRFAFVPGAFSILVFHDLLDGTSLDVAGQQKAKSGFRLSDIDRPEFDLVLGGDNHIPQVFDVRHTRGGYVGSVLGFNAGDADSPRGFLHIRLHRSAAGQVSMETERIVSCAPPIRAVETAISDFSSLAVPALGGAIVYVTVHGLHDDLVRHSDEDLAADFRARHPDVRHVNIVRRPIMLVRERIEGLEQSSDPLQDWGVYARSNKVRFQTLDPERVFEVGLRFLREARG